MEGVINHGSTLILQISQAKDQITHQAFVIDNMQQAQAGLEHDRV